MQVRVVAQPHQDATNLYEYLEAVTADRGITNLRFAVAWAKRSGLARIHTLLSDFRDRGGVITAIVGVSEGGATRQGLQLIRTLCNEAYVYHDHTRTFHPKVYLASGPHSAELFTGSNNLTAGGLFWNHEFATWISLDLSRDIDRCLYSEVLDWFEILRHDDQACRELTDTFLDELVQSARYRVADEDARATSGSATDSDSVPAGSTGPVLFGRSRLRKRSDPNPLDEARSGVRHGASVSSPRASARPRQSPAQPVRTMTWSKRLSASDAQQPRTSNSQVTGHLKLSRAGHPIDQTTYFRREFFAAADWTSTVKSRGVMEEAIVGFDTWIGDEYFGVQNMRVDHAEYRIAGQNNTPTWLHWNSHVGQYLRAHDCTGQMVVLESDGNGYYRLAIGRSASS
jgi:HKD family nuclease